MSVDELRNWLVPWEPNHGETDIKLFYRMQLGLSGTFTTIQLEANQLIAVADKMTGNRVMNDGCALMSRTLGRRVAEALGCENSVPSCFQGRIAGAKGVWIVDRDDSAHACQGGNNWIEISASQLKIKWKAGKHGIPLDPYWRQFEVVGHSKQPQPGRLSAQFVRILEDCGVPRQIFAQLLQSSMQQVSGDLLEAIMRNDRNGCRSLLSKLGALNVDRFTDYTWPSDANDQAATLLESGFEPLSCRYLFDLLRKCLELRLDSYVKKLHIPVVSSTSLYCIADPYDVLEPGEVYLSLSGRWEDGRFDGETFLNTDILVGRHPALRPCDIQKRRAVWKPELRHISNVIVFPATGQYSLAEILGGGDYDGDCVWVCWDPNIVGHFTNVEPPQRTYGDAELQLTHNGIVVTASYTEDFWVRMFTFHLERSMVGMCTNLHSYVSQVRGLRSSEALMMAAVASRLLSAHKSGTSLPQSGMARLKKAMLGLGHSAPSHGTTITEFLHAAATKERVAILTNLFQAYSAARVTDVDDTLLNVYQDLSHQGEVHSPLRDALHRLADRIGHIRKVIWASYRHRPGEFEAIVEEAMLAIQAIEPESFDHPLSQVWMTSPREWNRARAACVYAHHRTGKFAWFMVGRTLCQIKAESGQAISMRADTLACFKFSQNRFSRFLNQE
ncbi:RNA dependent RNA polymerase-domain-containing protein [Aspergillus pseudotamarii]|uniref:RNA-dependent RNA polymerase n=1 Tax=Aspergillus pseudotamarii TaxID=132259 RepID=A0A5N6SG31_ASPPS|nr:RNA dependent RNA polymerase-domain-containing protein [Aspergillus pseudotamarii]KAE8133686.1 RNA dependent RNA polymerase-domain-containing protein [Aspergillus pseudotamarii]